MMGGPARWSDQAQEVISGDITTAAAYLTPAGGAVVTAVATFGIADRDRGTVGFTTSLGFPPEARADHWRPAGGAGLSRARARVLGAAPVCAGAGPRVGGPAAPTGTGAGDHPAGRALLRGGAARLSGTGCCASTTTCGSLPTSASPTGSTRRWSPTIRYA